MALKIGFVGTGWVAGQHMKSLGQIAEANIVACTDVDADRAAEAASRFAGAAAYTDHRKMLDEAGLDAVYVCLPPHVHGQVELDIIERGLPFFLEKPLANEMETPRRILSAVQKKGLLTSVGYMMRYYPHAARGRSSCPHTSPSPPAAPTCTPYRACPGGVARSRAAARSSSRAPTSTT